MVARLHFGVWAYGSIGNDAEDDCFVVGVGVEEDGGLSPRSLILVVLVVISTNVVGVYCDYTLCCVTKRNLFSPCLVNRICSLRCWGTEMPASLFL